MAGFERTYALVVGIAGYAMIRTLPYTKDASDVAALLLDPEVCGYTGVKVLQESDASKDAIVQELERLAEVPKGSTVLIYFSGHGGHVEEGPNRGDYLLPVNCVYPDDDALARSSISGQAFTDMLTRIATRADQLVVILDCCHAGGIGETRELTAASVAPGLAEGALTLLAQGKGRVIIAATRAEDPAYVLEGARNGNFTRYLLQGLRGDARGHRGVIRVGDLFDYIQEKLANSSRPQHPVLKAVYEKNFPIALHLGGKSGSGETVRGGLGVLIRLARDPVLAPVLDRVRQSLNAAREQIALAVGLKSLHDALHDIQINQFEQILQERDRMGQDAAAARNLVRHARRAARRVRDLGVLEAVRQMPELQLEERLSDLAGAIAGIEEGAGGEAAQLIDQGIWELNHILSVVPSMVNNELKRVVRAMKLHDLFRALLDIQDRMQGSSARPEDVRCFAAGGRDLGRLDREIDDLLLQHDHWQRIDDRMRSIDNNGKGKPNDLEFAWPKLNTLIQQQLDAIDEGLREEIEEAFKDLQEAMSATDLNAKIEPFRQLRSCAGDWFYTVDKRLLNICKELEPIDSALSVVLTALKEASDERSYFA